MEARERPGIPEPFFSMLWMVLLPKERSVNWSISMSRNIRGARVVLPVNSGMEKAMELVLFVTDSPRYLRGLQMLMQLFWDHLSTSGLSPG